MSAAPSSPSLTARCLSWLADAIYHQRRWFLYPQVVLAVLCIFYTVRHLEFLTRRDALIGAEKEYHRIYMEFKQEFPVQDDLAVVVESENTERNRQFVERLGAKVQAETNVFSSVFYKGDLNTMGPKALLFMPEKDLQDLYKTLNDYRLMLVHFAQANNLVSLFNLVNTQFRTAPRRTEAENQSLVNALPALERIVTQANDSLGRLGNPPSPGVNSLFEQGPEAEQQMYITFDKGRIFLLTAQAKTDEENPQAVKRLRQLIAETQAEVPGTNVGLTGEPVLEVDEMAQSERDTTLATIISLVLVALIFIYGYHETGRPLKATLVLLVGLAYTMGFTTLAVGHLNILTITFVPMLVGLAIDFGVHLISRYEEELRRGRTERVALEKAMVNTGMGIFTGAFTTAGAFFAMGLSSFKGIREMGIICGGGMLLCLAAMMTMLPVLLLKGRQNVIDQEQGEVLDQRAAAEVERRARIESIWLRRPVTVTILTLALTALAAFPARRVTFDYNLLHMQTAGLPAVLFQDKLIKSSTRSVLFAALVADSVPQATRLIQTVTNLPTVASVESMATYLGEDQTRKLETLCQIKQVVADIPFAPVDRSPVDVDQLKLTLFSLHGYLGMAVSQTEKEDPALHRQLIELRNSIGTLIRNLTTGDRPAVSEKLAKFQQALFTDVHQTFQAIKNQDASGPLTANDLPEMLRRRFVGVHGKYLIMVYPKKDVWDRRNQEEFVRELRTVDRQVTGTPVQLLEYETLLKVSYENAAWYSLGAIVLLVFIHFRRFSCVVLALLPVGIGALWMAGVMGALGIPFNPANIMTLPLIIGIGVTNGIHILTRYAEEQTPSILARSTGKAVLVSGLTTIAGFGSLILAQHLGIRSLGIIMSTGVATCMLVGLTFLPALLNLLSKYGWNIKRPSGTMHDPHWVGRNRGINLKSEPTLKPLADKVKLYIKKVFLRYFYER